MKSPALIDVQILLRILTPSLFSIPCQLFVNNMVKVDQSTLHLKHKHIFVAAASRTQLSSEASGFGLN